MANMTYVDEVVESKSEKRVRLFLAVMFFIETVVTTLPFIQGETDDGYTYITAFSMLVQDNGYNSFAEAVMAIIGGILVIMPMVAFFFCVLDKKSKKKYVASGLCSVICAVAITFSMSSYSIALGAVITLIINVITLFMTSQGYQATRIRERKMK